MFSMRDDRCQLHRWHPALSDLRDLVFGLEHSKAREELKRLIKNWELVTLNALRRRKDYAARLDEVLIKLKTAKRTGDRLVDRFGLPVNRNYMGVRFGEPAHGRPPPSRPQMLRLLLEAAGESKAEISRVFETAVEEFRELSRELDQAERSYTEIEQTAERAAELVRSICSEHALSEDGVLNA